MGLVFALRWPMHRGLKRLAKRVIARVLNPIPRSGVLNRPTSRRLKRFVPPSLRLLAMNLQFARHAIDLRPDVVQSHDLNALLGGALV